MKNRVMAFCGVMTLLLGLTVALVTNTKAAPKQTAGTKEGPKVSAKAVSGKMRGSTDPNIKNAHNLNHKTDKTPAPAAKGGPKARGATGILHVDNSTRYYIKIYANGDYIGTIGPYGDMYRYYSEGSLRMYGRADFDDGSSSHWGPSRLTISEDETSTFTLNY